MKDASPGLHTYYAPIHRAISNTRNSPGPSSATCTIACTITWWKCSCTRRRAREGPSMTAAGRNAGGGDRTRRPDGVRRFMEMALYHPDAWLLPAAARSVRQAAAISIPPSRSSRYSAFSWRRASAQLWRDHGRAARVPRWWSWARAGGEMAEAFAEWRYVPVDRRLRRTAAKIRGRGVLQRILRRAAGGRGGVRAAAYSASSCVGFADGRFGWREGEPVGEASAEYLRAYFPPPEEGQWYEVNRPALAWLDRIADAMRAGYAVTVDYGYTRAEAVRFPAAR